jgi:Zn ribbon nucleic-acid-binding protein
LCKNCINKLKSIKTAKLYEQFIKEVYKLVKDEYVVLGKYVNSYTKILIRHNKCNFKYKVTPNKFLTGRRCPKCYKKIKKTTIQFKQIIGDLVGDEYEVCGDYINSKIKIQIKHNKCNYIHKYYPNSFLSGHRCPRCAGNLPYTTESFKDKIYEIVKDEYEVKGEYINISTKILLEHKLCGFSWKISPNSFLVGKRCPQCAESKGEQKIRHWLEDNNNNNYQSQYIFINLLSDIGNFLRFDFIIFDKINNIKCLIEYDGKQHYRWTKWMMPNKDFKKLKYHDQLKNQYCQQHNIPLLRIPYWDFDNIETILTDYLIKEV